LTYDGLPITCYGCGKVGNIYNACPHRRSRQRDVSPLVPTTYAMVASVKTGTNVSTEAEGPKTLLPLPPVLTDQETNRTGVDLWWSSDVETAPPAPIADASTETDFAEIHTASTLIFFK
jgi:hypothetical protein